MSNPNNDYMIPNPPDDSVSEIAWNPNGNYLACGSWACDIRLWEIGSSGAQSKAQQKHDGPVLSLAFTKDGSKLISGGADNAVKCWDLASNQFAEIGRHDQPVKVVKWAPEQNVCVTGSWDKTMRFWDLRQPQPAATNTLSERVYAMDIIGNLCVVGTADNKILIYNLQNPTQQYKLKASPLTMQTRCISCFPNQTGFAIGSIEGRVGIQYIEDNMETKNFTFKCHRDNSNAFAINSLAFHRYGTFATTGSDGGFSFWDKDSKQRLKQFKKLPLPIVHSSFSPQGNIYAYAISYDWSKGADGYKGDARKSALFLHNTPDAEIKQRDKKR